MPPITCAGVTDIGLKRSNNEDTLVMRPDLGLLTVADGMGGAASGEVASRIFGDTAIDVFSAIGPQSDEMTAELVQKVFLLSNKRILEQVALNQEHHGMGCTAELLAFHDRSYVLGHVGDSRSYLFRNGKLRQMTKDHSFIQEQIDQGFLTREAARNHTLKNIIVRAVGVKETLAVDLIRGVSRPGDLFLLCSDGLTDLVEDALIETFLSLSINLNRKAKELVESAKSAGGYDNITVALCQVS